MAATHLAVPASGNALSRESDGQIEVSLTALPPKAELAALWHNLEIRADGSLATSWTWISAWLETVAAMDAADRGLLTARFENRVVGLAILQRSTRTLRLGPVATTTYPVVLLHQTGKADLDSIYVEYNGLLTDRAHAAEVWHACLAFFASADFSAAGKWRWREFVLAGIDEASTALVRSSGARYRLERHHFCPWIDFTMLAEGADSLVESFSANSRQQMRRAQRLAENAGPLTVTAAGALEEARAFLAELSALHQQAWRDRKGHDGAYASAAFPRFAEALVQAAWSEAEENPIPDAGENPAVDVLRIRAGQNTLGVLIVLIHRGHAFIYQSGFAFGSDNREKPGLVSHFLAALHYRGRGLQGYHFMAGNDRYKQSLANRTEELFWLTFRRNDFVARTGDALRTLKAMISNRHAKTE